MIVTKFEIEESKFNKGMHILVATTETGERFVVAGQHHSPTYLERYEHSSDAIGKEAWKKLTGHG